LKALNEENDQNKSLVDTLNEDRRITLGEHEQTIKELSALSNYQDKEPTPDTSNDQQ